LAVVDSYGRLLARHIGKHIPGTPTVVPVNMPGGGGAAQHHHARKHDVEVCVVVNASESLLPSAPT
jgi:hypothetical protein